MSLDFPPTLRKPWLLLDYIASLTFRSIRMIVKSVSPPPVEQAAFHLSFLDQNVVRVYTQTLSIFPVSNDTEHLVAVHLIDLSSSFATKMKPKLQSKLLAMDFA
jgi:hypothetical protein